MTVLISRNVTEQFYQTNISADLLLLTDCSRRPRRVFCPPGKYERVKTIIMTGRK